MSQRLRTVIVLSAAFAAALAALLRNDAAHAQARPAVPATPPSAPSFSAPSTSAEDMPLVLVYSRTADFRHDSIAAGVAMLRELGAEHGFAIDHSEDPAVFATRDLARYRAVLWLNTT